MAKEYRFIGKPTPRKDAAEIVTGKARFIDDIKVPEMLYGKILRSPFAHARIRSIETAKAEAFPGVECVLTYQNVPDWKSGWPPHVGVLDSKVRFVGDAVALVAARTKEIAEEALDRIEVEYEPLPAVYDVEEALEPGAPQLYDQFSNNTLPPGFPAFGPKCLKEIVSGDVEKGFAEADFISEGRCRYESLSNPLPIEPPGVIVKWEGPRQLTVWSATQSLYFPRLIMQPLMGFPDIRSICEHCGGSYGSKNNAAQLIFYAAALAKVTGKPVKVMYTKQEHLSAFVLRLGSRFQGKVGLKKDGTVTSVSGDWLVNTGAFSDVSQGQVAVALGEAQLMLRCSNWNLKPKIVFSNRNASGIVKGFGGQEINSALTPILAKAMEKAGLDPVEFFKKNYVKNGDGYYWRDGKWWVYRGPDYVKAIDKGAEVFGWKEKWKGWLKPTAIHGSKRTGVGVGVQGNADVGENVTESYIRLNPDGTATIYVSVSESGMGQRSSLCKMVAEVLQLPMDRVNLTPADSLVNPFEGGLIGSRGTYAVGSAVIAAAEEARGKLLNRAAPLLHATPEDLETEDGIVFLREKPGIKISWNKAIGIRGTLTGSGRFEEDFTVPNFIMLFVEVEVDVETGEARLRLVVPATDVGQIIDPLVLEGQMHGSLGAAGLDTALFEETVLDKATGRLLNCNMIDYKWRTFLDLPQFQNVILETPFPTHRFKAIGVGEITSGPGPSAIMMAVSNAIGKWVADYPLMPDKILRALGKIEGGQEG